MHVLPPTFKPVLQQIRFLEVAKSSSKKKRVTLLFAAKTVHMRVLPAQGKIVLKQVRNSRVWRNCRVILSNQKSVYTLDLQQVLFFCKTGLNMGGKTCNIAIQLVFQQCYKTSCTFFLPVLPQLKRSLLADFIFYVWIFLFGF